MVELVQASQASSTEIASLQEENKRTSHPPLLRWIVLGSLFFAKSLLIKLVFPQSPQRNIHFSLSKMK